MKDQRGCSQCSYVAGDDVVRCPECGSWMRKAQGIRRRGWVLIFLGFLLVAMMGMVTFMVAPAMLSAGSAGARFTGTQEQAMLILGLFGLVIGFGFTCVVSGVWQIVTGRRNIWIVILILGLTFLLIVAGGAVRKALGVGLFVAPVTQREGFHEVLIRGWSERKAPDRLFLGSTYRQLTR